MKSIVALWLMLGGVCAAAVGKPQIADKMRQHELVPAPRCEPVQTAPRNVILMIGDGMSAELTWAAWVCNGGKLNMTQLPVTGFARTFSANHLITDSAAAGTALACACKTNNRMLGQTPDGAPRLSLAARFAAAPFHKRVGLVVTKAITDATPAAFYAHVADRKHTAQIARALCESPLSVLVGGGAAAFSEAQMQALKNRPDSLVHLAAAGDCPYAEQRGDFLPRYTRLALEKLQEAPNGFFLMIEGSEIDSAAHAADLRLAVQEVLDFDRAVGEVLRWMQTHPDTLLVITADHQTGGLSILDGSLSEARVKAVFSATQHTGVAVPVYAAGCGANFFSGVMDNTQIPAEILEIAEK